MDTQFKYEIRSLQLFWTLFWKIKVATEKCFKKKPECDAASSPYRKKELRTSLYLKLAIQKLTPLMEDF